MKTDNLGLAPGFVLFVQTSRFSYKGKYVIVVTILRFFLVKFSILKT